MVDDVIAEKTTTAPKGVKDFDKELSEFNQTLPKLQTDIKTKKTTRSKQSKTKKTKISNKTFTEKGKRKEAIARATLSTNGNGKILLNGISIEYIKPKEIKEIVMEPLNIAPAAMEIASKSNIYINVHGGGVSGRAQAARNALAKAVVKASGSEELKNLFMQYDRNIMIDDHRRVEPKKFKGPKARARFQTSYR